MDKQPRRIRNVLWVSIIICIQNNRVSTTNESTERNKERSVDIFSEDETYTKLRKNERMRATVWVKVTRIVVRER